MKPMNITEAYHFAFNILVEFWRKTQDDQLAAVLGGLNPEPLSEGTVTTDPAAWHDWVDAVKKVTSNENITESEAQQAMLVVMREYRDHDGLDLTNVIDFLNKRT